MIWWFILMVQLNFLHIIDFRIHWLCFSAKTWDKTNEQNSVHYMNITLQKYYYLTIIIIVAFLIQFHFMLQFFSVSRMKYFLFAYLIYINTFCVVLFFNQSKYFVFRFGNDNLQIALLVIRIITALIPIILKCFRPIRVRSKIYLAMHSNCKKDSKDLKSFFNWAYRK